MGKVLGVVVAVLVGGLLAGAASIGIVSAQSPPTPEPISFDFDDDYGSR